MPEDIVWKIIITQNYNFSVLSLIKWKDVLIPKLKSIHCLMTYSLC